MKRNKKSVLGYVLVGRTISSLKLDNIINNSLFISTCIMRDHTHTPPPAPQAEEP
jgi:hypothetical protein